ncbi:hypothetical protein GCM10018954_056730 [Kutzneria kofuensis]
MADLLEHGGTGRLLRRDVSGEVTELLDGLQFANGVALSADESYVAVAETGSYRISRVWLDTGRSEVLADNLPGIPDNLSTGADGLIWVALATPRNPVLDWTASRNPLLRKATWALPPSVLTRFEVRTTWVVAIDDSGAHRAGPADLGAGYHMVTGVRQHGGKLYLGSLREQGIAVIDCEALDEGPEVGGQRQLRVLVGVEPHHRGLTGAAVVQGDPRVTVAGQRHDAGGKAPLLDQGGGVEQRSHAPGAADAHQVGQRHMVVGPGSRRGGREPPPGHRRRRRRSGYAGGRAGRRAA